jgi:hypothetical protein
MNRAANWADGLRRIGHRNDADAPHTPGSPSGLHFQA